MHNILNRLQISMHRKTVLPICLVVITIGLTGKLCAGEQPALDTPIPTFEGISNSLPIYPSESLKLKESGKVLLKVQVDQLGKVGNAVVVSSSTHPKLDWAVLDAVNAWTFKPKRIGGVAFDDWAWVSVSFEDSKVIVETLLTSDPKYWVQVKKGCRVFDYNTQPGLVYDWTGACAGGYVHGEGRLTAMKNGFEVYTMTGSYQHGLMEGYAIRVIADQSEYKGDFLRGLKHGKGLQVWKHGMRYEGDFVDNCMTGQGLISWKNGVKYEGKFLDGKAVDQEIRAPERKSEYKLSYPEELKDANVNGEVFLSLWLADDGHLTEVKVLQSDHPALEKEALRAIVATEFLPATINGKAIPVILRQPIIFGNKTAGFKPYEVRLDRVGEASAGGQFTYIKPDRLPTFQVTAPLVYPYDLMLNNVRGEASALVTIDPLGQPTEIKIRSASQPEFADAMRAMLASSVFNPAMKNGVGIWSNLKLSRKFSRNGGDAFFDAHIVRLLGKIKDNQSGIFKLADLDRKPRAIFQPLPTPPNDESLHRDEKVIVAFYIDKTGRVQLPHVINTNRPELGWLAMTAISRWQFEPPRVKGEPVDVLVTLPVLFSASQTIENPPNKDL